MNKPFFSVVLPTRNRSHLLPFAIRSVLDQTFGDFEFIISDNFSLDETPDIVKSFNDPRIKYVRTERSLNISDSWDFGLSHASGEYISFISDDDAYARTLLKRTSQVIREHAPQILAFQYARYYHDGDVEFGRQIPANTLVFNSFTGNVTKFDSEVAGKLIYRIFGFNTMGHDEDFIVPFLSNAVYHHSVFSRLKAVRKNLFDSTPADWYLAAAVFYVIDSYYCLDEPLYVWSNWAENATASAHKKADGLRAHYEKLLNGQSLEYTPLKFALEHNCGADAVLKAKADFDRADTTETDWGGYYVFSYDKLRILKNLGVNVTPELLEFHTKLAQEPAEVRNFVNSQIHNFRFSLKHFLRNFPFLIRVGKLIFSKRRSDRQILVGGRSNGFDSVLGAANALSAQISRTRHHQ